MRTSIDDIQRQMGQMATSINELRSQGSNRLPSQTMVNPKENLNAIHLRSGKISSESVPKNKRRSVKEILEGEQEARNSDQTFENSGQNTEPNRPAGRSSEKTLASS